MQIYECIYQDNQPVTNDHVRPLVINNDHPERRELQAYVQAYQQGLHKRHERVGIFSPKFSLKSRISAGAFKAFCQEHPQANVCHINPFPHIRYWSYNAWEQGESFHPGLMASAQALLDAVGIAVNIAQTPRHDARLLAYCNFWIADQAFWESYVGGVLKPISDFLDEHPDHPATQGVLQNTQHTTPTPFLPFIIERLYSTWISTHPALNVAAYPIALDDVIAYYCKTDFKRLLVRQMHAMVDQCDADGHFSAAVRQRMSDMCALYRQHMLDFYENRPHPHTGEPIQRLAG